MIARYIGTEDTFTPGQVYLLKVEEQGDYVLMTSPQLRPYRDWKAFFKNWERVDRASRP